MAAPSPSGPDRIRDTAKWTIVAFAGVGAALAAGLQISNLGSVDDTERLVAAGVGAGLGLAGVLLAIWHVSKVLAPQTATMADLTTSQALRTRLREDATFGGGFSHGSVEELVADYERAFKAYRAAELRRYADTPSTTRASVKELNAYAAIAAESPQDVANSPPSQEDVAALKAVADNLGSVVQFHREVVIYEKVWATWLVARWWLGAGAVMAFVGLALFAWAANPPKEDEKNATTTSLFEGAGEHPRAGLVTISGGAADQTLDSVRAL